MSSSPASLSEQVFTHDGKEPVAGIGWINETAFFALGDGRCLCLSPDKAIKDITPHPDGAILVVTSEQNSLLTGGDDGRIVRISQTMDCETVIDRQGGWIDALTVHSDGSVAFSSGKHVTVKNSKGVDKTFEAPSSVRGLAFAPKGYRLALSHYNGVSLWFPNTDAAPELLPWKGSHIDVTWSPDARFVISSMQENALHGWRLGSDKTDMRMAGYPSKTRSLSWTADKKWLATSGAEAVILWPFDTKTGPMGQRPKECGARPARITQVAAHPVSPVLAAGYEDGAIYLLRLSEPGEIIVQQSGEHGTISALKWHANGHKLAFGSENGFIGMLDL